MAFRVGGTENRRTSGSEGMEIWGSGTYPRNHLGMKHLESLLLAILAHDNIKKQGNGHPEQYNLFLIWYCSKLSYFLALGAF